MRPQSAGDVTHLLRRLAAGERAAESELLEVFYPHLRRLAGSYMRRERSDHTLQPTALIHEAYLKVFGQRLHPMENPRHLSVVMAKAMRNVLIDYARRRRAAKGPGDQVKTSVESKKVVDVGGLDRDALLDVASAMEELERVDERACHVAYLRHYLGMTLEEAANELNVAERTVQRDWDWARAFLSIQLRGGRAKQAKTAG